MEDDNLCLLKAYRKERNGNQDRARHQKVITGQASVGNRRRKKMRLKVKKVHIDAILPSYMTDGAVGFDIYNLVSKIIRPRHMELLRTGIAVQVPDGYEMTVRPRSGLSLFIPNYLANSIGTIDSDYRGEILIPFVNTTKKHQRIYQGERIAQGIISPIIRVKIMEVEELEITERGANGFGSTG